MGSCPHSMKILFHFQPTSLPVITHPIKAFTAFHAFAALASPASPYFLPLALCRPLKILNQTFYVLSIPAGTVPAPQPASRQQGQKTATVVGKLEAATRAVDAAGTERGVPGPTSWKQDRNTPQNKPQPLSLPLQALSSAAPEKKLVHLLREISWCYLALLRSPPPGLPRQTGEARQDEREFIGCFPRPLLQQAAEGPLSNSPWFPMPPRLPVPGRLLGAAEEGAR